MSDSTDKLVMQRAKKLFSTGNYSMKEAFEKAKGEVENPLLGFFDSFNKK